MISSKDKEQSYRSVPDGAYYHGMTIIIGEVYHLLMWNDLLDVKGTDREMKSRSGSSTSQSRALACFSSSATPNAIGLISSRLRPAAKA